MDVQAAAAFLSALGGSEKAAFTFQTFDDNKRKNPLLSQILHGTLDDCIAELTRLNEAGAGVFVTVNETDLRGRRIENIVKTRALFVDLDGAPVDPILAYEPKPHILIESSPGRWHAYWLVDDLPLAEFAAKQKALATQFQGDPKINDLPRVMRLPGFIHGKGEPFETRVEEIRLEPHYPASLFAAKEEEAQKPQRPTDRRAAGEMRRLNDMAMDNLDRWVPALFPRAKHSGNVYRISSKMLGRDLEEDLSISRQGIKDFGIHDMGDKKEGARTPIDLIAEYGGKTVAEAVLWLRDKLDYGGAQIDDFWAYLPKHDYIYTPTNQHWPAVSLNSRWPKVPLFDRDGKPLMEEKTNRKGEVTEKQMTMTPSVWLDKNKPLEHKTWVPGEPRIIRDRFMLEGGWVDRMGVTSYNEYRPSTVRLGDPNMAGKWTDHIMRIYPDDGRHIIYYLAQRVQQPEVKVNHSLFLGGAPGIGKDTILEPIVQIIGPWNFAEIDPKDLFEKFNPFVKSVIIRISELRDGIDRYQFYEASKKLMAAPPHSLLCNDKNEKAYHVLNCCGIIMTSNYRTGAIFLDKEDRRHYVAWSEATQNMFDAAYWNDLWGWYDHGHGINHIAAYLHAVDLSQFDPKAPPLKTQAFHDVANSELPQEEPEFKDTLEKLKKPKAVTLEMIQNMAEESFRGWLKDRKNKRSIPHRLERCGYKAYENKKAADHFWKINGRRQVVYVLMTLQEEERYQATMALVNARDFQDDVNVIPWGER